MTPDGRDTDRRNQPLDAKAALELLRTQVSARVRPFVTHLPEADVARLIEQIVQVKFKYEGFASLRRTPAAAAHTVRESERQQPLPGDRGST